MKNYRIYGNMNPSIDDVILDPLEKIPLLNFKKSTREGSVDYYVSKNHKIWIKCKQLIEKDKQLIKTLLTESITQKNRHSQII